MLLQEWRHISHNVVHPSPPQSKIYIITMSYIYFVVLYQKEKKKKDQDQQYNNVKWIGITKL